MNTQLNKILFFLLAWHHNTYDMTNTSSKKTNTNIKSAIKETKEVNNNINPNSSVIFILNDKKKSSEEIIHTLRLHMNTYELKQMETSLRSMVNHFLANQDVNENAENPQNKEIEDLINNQLSDQKKEQEKNLKDISGIYNHALKIKCVYLFFLIEIMVIKDINCYNIVKKYFQKLKTLMQEKNNKTTAALAEYMGAIENIESIQNIEDNDILKVALQQIESRIHPICEELILKILDYLEQQNYDNKLFYIQINNDKLNVTQIVQEIKNDLKKQDLYDFIIMVITYIILYKELPFDDSPL